MLERPGLWLSPRFDSRLLGLGPGSVRHLVDASTRTHAGRARYAHRTWGAAWRTAEALRVEEGIDQALLCVVRRSPWWEGGTWVLDADDQPVGHWQGTAVQLVRDSQRATVQASVAAGRLWVGGETVVEWSPDGSGTRLTFGPASEGRPFLRMAGLAVCLAAT